MIKNTTDINFIAALINFYTGIHSLIQLFLNNVQNAFNVNYGFFFFFCTDHPNLPIILPRPK